MACFSSPVNCGVLEVHRVLVFTEVINGPEYFPKHIIVLGKRMLGLLAITAVTYRDRSLPAEMWPWTRPQGSCRRLLWPRQEGPGGGEWSCAALWLMELPCRGWVCLEEFREQGL